MRIGSTRVTSRGGDRTTDAAQLSERITGRLRTAEADKMWRANSASERLHDVRLHGLQLPLISGRFPPPGCDDVNRIPVGERLDWARGAVAELEHFGAVAKWTDVLSAGAASSPRPHVIMPLIVGEKSTSTPETRKFRSVHDAT